MTDDRPAGDQREQQGEQQGEPQEPIDDRKAAVLRAIVERYVASATPVGSQTIARTRELDVSAATVRNDMGFLEREGYIAQPYTSAGRIPTDVGYRYYVDHFVGAGSLPSPQRREIADFFTTTARAIEDLLHETSLLLARLTDHAAVVVGPQADVAHIRSVQLVQLQPWVVLLVVVLSNGAVEKETLVLDADTEIDESDVAAATARLGSLLEGSTLASLPTPGEQAPADAADGLVSAALDGLAARIASGPAEPLYVGGVGHLAAEQDDFTLSNASQLLELLEQHVVVVTLLRELLGPGVTVRIGAENEHDDLRECSLVLAPYLVEGEPVGSIGVLGPTRMDYRRARAAVTSISRQLGRRLSS